MNGLEGGETPDVCVNCTGGFYCDTPGTVEATKQCDPGYYCPPGRQLENTGP